MQIYTVESLSGRRIKEGDLIYANAVLAANLLRDAREAVQNVIGGKLRRYEGVLDRAMAQAIEALKEKAVAAGYDGVAGVRVSSPYMVSGAASITVYGTGFNFIGGE